MSQSASSTVAASAIQQTFNRLGRQLEQRLIGRETLIERLLIALLVRGHVLIEGSPGLAKTRAVKMMAEALSVQFVRIQATPDLLPADLTGTTIYRPENARFEFSPGPLFSNIVLVDEINRAPPKVQSALLEAMGESQISVAGTTHALDDPFMVVATQNPIEHEGTYPLPEAQLDRFVFLVNVAMPDLDEELRIIDLVEQENHPHEVTGETVLTSAMIAAAITQVRMVHLSDAVKNYVARLVTATRGHGVDKALTELIEHPASPRGSLALVSGARARAWLQGRDYVLPDDVTALASDAISGRISLSYKARAEGVTARHLVAQLIDQVGVI